MALFNSTQDILARLREGRAREPIVGGGAGTGITANREAADRPARDLQLRPLSMAGRGSLGRLLPYGDANAIVMDMAREVLPVVKHTPVLAGVCGTDPFIILEALSRRDAAGFSGVQNFPTVGLFDGKIRTPRRNRHELRPGSRHDPHGARNGTADDAVRLQSRRSDGAGGGRRRLIIAHLGVTTGVRSMRRTRSAGGCRAD